MYYREIHTCGNSFDFPQEAKKAEVSGSLINNDYKPVGSKLHAELTDMCGTMRSAEDVHKSKKLPVKLNHFCAFSTPSIMSVVGHHNGKHFAQHSTVHSKQDIYNSRLKEQLHIKLSPP